MSKFKVGDKVRCISTDYEDGEFTIWIKKTKCKVGGIYDVTGISDEFSIKLANSHGYWLDKKQFEVV